LPRKTDGLKDLEDKFTIENVQGWLSKLHRQKVVVYVPKFKTTSEFNLKKELISMGMIDAFDVRLANFSGMNERTDLPLFIDAVVHKAFVDVSEKEIDMMVRYLQHEPPQPPEWGMKEMKDSWKVIIPENKRPKKKMNKYDISNIFSVTLRDAGQVALIDGDSKKIINI
ncbi:MAG: hypothetical protein CEE43_15575, partial [Promethearchaeota archaeon Loki_b32]